MKPQRFKPGQEITPKDNKPWRILSFNNDLDAVRLQDPQFGKIYIVDFYDEYIQKSWFICLKGFDDNYDEDDFEPVITDKQLIEELETIKEPAFN